MGQIFNNKKTVKAMEKLSTIEKIKVVITSCAESLFGEVPIIGNVLLNIKANYESNKMQKELDELENRINTLDSTVREEVMTALDCVVGESLMYQVESDCMVKSLEVYLSEVENDLEVERLIDPIEDCILDLGMVQEVSMNLDRIYVEFDEVLSGNQISKFLYWLDRKIDELYPTAKVDLISEVYYEEEC